MTPTRFFASFWPALIAAALAACGDSTTTEPQFDTKPRVAITQFEANKPVLYTGLADGTLRVRIPLSNVTDPIPGNFGGLVVNDANLLALGAPSIAPQGDRIAVVATLAFDQSEIVVMKSDGSSGEVASVNTQIIGSDPKWSPDGTRLAYTMSTLPGFKGLDLFVTDLTTHTVTRVTNGANVVNATIRWSIDGKTLFYSRTTGSTTTGTDNSLSEIVRVDVASKATQTVASNIIGQITAVGGAGNRALVTRNVAKSGGGTTRALIELNVGGSERVIVDADASYAHYLSSFEARAMVVTATVSGTDVTRRYLVYDLLANTSTAIANVPGEANVDVYFPPLPD